MKKWIPLLVMVFMLVTAMIVGATPSLPIHDHDHESLATAAESGQYVGNLNSHKFHIISCRYVGRMNPSNKVFFDTRDDAINEGYVPCKVCKP